MEIPKNRSTWSWIRVNEILAASYFVYTGIAAAILIFIVVVNSQASIASISISLVFGIVLTSPLPMVLVGVALLRHCRYGVLLAFVLALAQALATAVQFRIARGNSIGTLDAGRAALFYVCVAQTFYLPGSLLLAPLSSVVVLLRRARR